MLYLGPDLQDEKNDPFKWYALLKGPDETPYEGGTFKLQIFIPDDYPYQPPKVEFMTPIYHPNIATTSMKTTGATICLDILDPKKYMWHPSMTIQRVMLGIACLMADPNPGDPLCPDIGKEMLRDKKKFESKAKLSTY